MWEKICSILYDAYLFKNYGKYKKKLINIIVLVFDLRLYSVYLFFEQFYLLGKNLQIFDIFSIYILPPPLYGTSKHQGLNVTWVNFFLNEEPKTNISAKLNTFIRNVNVSTIIPRNTMTNNENSMEASNDVEGSATSHPVDRIALKSRRKIEK